jgi:TolA-binding protein
MRTPSSGWKPLAAAVLLLAGAAARADNNEWAQLGAEHMAAGRYAAAIKALEKITPTYEHIIIINFDLAWCYYLTSAYAKAIPLFENLSGPRAPSEEIKQQCHFLLAECKARLADRQELSNPERKKNIEAAIELQTKFMAAYPKSIFIPNSIYGRAYAYFLADQFDRAENDLLALIKTYPANSAARDGQYLLANVYSQQALTLLKAAKTTEAQPLLDKARKLFTLLSKIEGNLAMANDSTLALAETWFNAGYYQDAIRFYREVRAKQDVVLDLRARLATLDTQRAAAIGKGLDTSLIKAEIDKLKAQYSSIGEGPDLMLSGYIRIAQCFFQLRQFEEARIVCRHILPFLQAAQKPEVAFMIVNAFIADKDAAGAAAALDDFRQSFGAGQPLAEMAGLAIGQLFFQENRPAQALEQFANSIDDYPNGKGIEDGFFMKLTAEFLLNQHRNVTETAETYLEKFPKGKYLPNALYFQALSLAALKEWDEAVNAISQLLQNFPEKTEHFQVVDEAAYQKGWILYQKALALKPEAYPEKQRKQIKELKAAAFDQAIKQFESFLAAYPASKLRPIGMYQMAIVLNAADQLDKAKAALQELAKQYPAHEIAPTALYQVAVMYYEKQDFPRMADALEALVQAYPNAPIIPEAYFWLGFIAKKNAAFDEATEALGQSVATGPANPLAPECLSLMAQAYREKAEALGLPVMLSEERKRLYRTLLLDSARTYEDLLANYRNSAQAQESISAIAKNIFDLVQSRLLKEDEAAAWFEKAKARHAADPDIKSRLAFSLGSFYLKFKDKEKALPAFKESLTINPDTPLSPVMLSDYAEALKDANQMAEAEVIYQKIIANYASDPRAVAPAWFGIADIKYRQNDVKAAEAAFDKVIKEFPWYEPGKQGKVKLAMIRENNKQYDEAEKMYTEVWKQEKGEARISAMLGVARCQLARAADFKKQANITAMKTMVKAADDNVTKIIVLYEAFPDYVSEAFWLKGQLYEIAEDPVKARASYEQLVRDYKNYPAAKKAAERLQKLGGPPPAATQ